MQNKSKNIIVLITVLILSGLIYAWFYPLDNGTLKISSNETGFQIMVGNQSFDCSGSPCNIKLKTGASLLRATKEDRYEIVEPISIRRFKTFPLELNFKKVPSLRVSNYQPVKKVGLPLIPKELITANGDSVSWNHNNTAFSYLDETDHLLKVWEKDSGLTTITTLQKVNQDAKIIWSPNEEIILITDKSAIFVINIESSSRKKIPTAFYPINIMWAKDSQSAWLNDAKNKLYELDIKANILTEKNISLPLNQSTWNQDNRLMYYTVNNEESSTTVSIFDPIKNETSEILTKSAFVASLIESDDNGSAQLYNTVSGSWSVLDY